MNLSTLLDEIENCMEHYSKADDLIHHLIEKVRSYNIKITYELIHNENKEKVNYIRVLLSTQRNRANFNIPLVKQCSGVIVLIDLQKQKCKILAKPPEEFLFINKFRRRNIAYNIDKQKYNIYQIEDGTTITLYFDPITEKWCISTKNGYDVSSLEWRGYNYQDALNEVLEEYPDFSFNNLDKKYSYTIGFKHPSMHPFMPDKKAWFISTNSNDDLQIGIPKQEKVNIKSDELFQNLDRALKEYLKNGKINYGYILRPNKSDIESNKNWQKTLLAESSLMSNIRELIYQLPFTRNPTEFNRQKQYFKDMKYVILLCYLDATKRDLFWKLFNQYHDKFKKLNVMINRVVSYIIKLRDNPTEIQSESFEFKLATRLNQFVGIIYDKGRQGNISSSKKNTQELKSTIKDIITKPMYAPIYYDILIKNNL